MMALRNDLVAARAPWSGVVPAGGTLEVIDLEENQAVDCLFYLADNTAERYSAPETLTWQGSIYLGVGSVLRSDTGRPLLTVIADGVGR
ncbi:MAG TPA: urea carboxylase-associated family protein, partial [Acidimicrobiales bacterium]|nr:urea carboxylase-associated family protein [Acidimicrobiales bacterium]